MQENDFSEITEILASELPSVFEEAMVQLERLNSAMEQGQLPLEMSLKVYERGTQLYQRCAEQLKVAENRIKVLEDATLNPLQGDF